MNQISSWAIKNPIPIILLFTLLTLAGIVGFSSMRINNNPDIDFPLVNVVAARPGAALFVFTFSRNTLPLHLEPFAGETFVFTEFAGEPQCFLSEAQLIDELGAAGFVPEATLPLKELNRPSGLVRTGGPVIYEGGFRRVR